MFFTLFYCLSSVIMFVLGMYIEDILILLLGFSMFIHSCTPLAPNAQILLAFLTVLLT